MALQPFVGSLQLYQFFDPIHGRTFWTGDQPDARALPTHRTTQTQNRRIQTSMPQPTIPASEGAKTVDAFDRSATAIGLTYITNINSRDSDI
jgi:hypothetical protein